MPITTYSSYKSKVEDSPYRYPIIINSTTTVANKMFSTWTAAPGSGVAPSTAVTCGRSTVGNIWRDQMTGARANDLYLAQTEIATGTSSAFNYFLSDRLSHQGGLSGTVSGSEQTTNLPTAALNRYTDGLGVMIGIEIYTQVGTGTATLTARYTNQAGTGNRTTQSVPFGGTGDREAGRFTILPLQDDDLGVLSVQGVTLSGSTATAGNFGLTLFRPLSLLSVALQQQVQGSLYRDMITSNGGGGLQIIHDDACIFALLTTPATGHNIVGTATLIEG